MKSGEKDQALVIRTAMKGRAGRSTRNRPRCVPASATVMFQVSMTSARYSVSLSKLKIRNEGRIKL